MALKTEQVKLPGVEVTRYVVAVPSARNETTAEVFPATAVGAAIPPVAVNDVDAPLTKAVSLLPDGVTVKVYPEPLVKLDTVQDCVPVGAVVVLITVHVGEPVPVPVTV